MNAQINAKLCTGCGLCMESCIRVFRIVHGVAVVTQDPVPNDCITGCREAMKACPTQALTLVSSDVRAPAAAGERDARRPAEHLAPWHQTRERDVPPWALGSRTRARRPA